MGRNSRQHERMSTAEAQRIWRARHGARTGVRGRVASAPCGTLAAHKRHVRHGEAPCELCRLAARADRGFRRNSSAWRRSDRAAWLLHRASLDELLASPKRVLDQVQACLDVQRRSGAHDEAPRRARWEQLLGGPLLDLASAMIGLDDDAKQLRSTTPFIGIVDEARRASVLARSGALGRTPRKASRPPNRRVGGGQAHPRPTGASTPG